MNRALRSLRGPLAHSYPAAALLVVCALIPYLVLTSALAPLAPLIAHSTGLSQQAVQLTFGMANAGYAVGTVLAVQFAQRLRQRRMLLLYAVLLVLGSALAASALSPGLFIAGHVLQGLSTSLMLIAAVPPLIIGWPPARMRYTAVILNLCIFGAVAAGPLVGGVQAAAHQWQPLFWIVTGIGAAALGLAVLTFEDVMPQDPTAPWDVPALLLAVVGSAAAFFGASELLTHPFLRLVTALPLLGGVTCISLLVVYQYLRPRSLMPVREAATTFPVAGIVIAITAAAASVAVIALVQVAWHDRTTPLHLGILLSPLFGGAVLSAALLGLLFRTRYVAVLALAGMASLTGGAAMFTGVMSGSQAMVYVGSGVVGLGVGASVSPALFLAGFSLPTHHIQRIFALIELLRGVAAFMAAPVILHFATSNSHGQHAGITNGIWIAVGLAAAGGLVALLLLIFGAARLQRPDLERWFASGDTPAWESPSLLAGLGSRHTPSGRSQPRRRPATTRERFN